MILTTDHCLEMLSKKNVNIILLHYNLTGRFSGKPRVTSHFLNILFVIFSFIIIVENLIVLIALFRFLHVKRWIHCCVANMASSDLLAGISYLINICLSGSNTFLLTPKIWFVREGLLFRTLTASTFTLLVTAVERYSTMVLPISENHTAKLVRVQAFIILCWLVAAVVGFSPLCGWNCLCQIEKCSSLLPLYSQAYIIFSLGMLGFTLLGSIVFYGAIYCFVWSSAKGVMVTNQSQQSFQLLKTVLIILGCFVLCWSPLFAYFLLDAACPPLTCKSPLGLEWILALAVLNSACNPLIYSIRSSRLRKAILALLCRVYKFTGVRPPPC